MNVFLRELTAYRKSTIIWAVSLSGVVLLFMGLFPAFTNDIAATREVLSGFPEAVRNALNLSLANFFTLNGFYGYLLNFAILTASIQAMNAGVGVISKEVSGKTADFLLSKPVTRVGVITAKLTAALTTILIIDVVFSAVAFSAALAVSKEPFDTGVFFLMSLTVLLVQLVFFAMGALFAVVAKKIKSVISVTLPTVFTFFIIGTLGDVLGQEKVRYVSPFKFYDTNYIIQNSSLEGRYLLVEVVFIAVAIALSYVIFIKKDVRSSS